ncbi:MAG: CPBP family intramembrane metalloprotease [Bacteroidales bacterium]|nr:CPBP family intramembrane metalloprotease [Bacteroidales bacterium]
MSFLKPRKVEKNYDLLSSCSWFTPDVGGLFAVLGWFLVGMILGSLFVMPFMFGGSMPLYYVMLILYPLQFVPVFIFVRIKSMRNMTFDTGYALDSNHFGKWGGALLALAVSVGMLAAGVLLEPVNQILPDTEGSIMEQLEKMMDGPLWVNIITMCIMAPIMEEWLCRGVILRGLLNYGPKSPRLEGERSRGLSPGLAIVISALFFAAIHGNVWQGVTAFAIGCLLGYVYYKTGSLKLTILMHCVNNTFAVLVGKFATESMKDAKSMLDMMPTWEFAIYFAASFIIILWLVSYLRDISLQDPQGNCDVIPSAEDEALQGS